MKFNDCAEDLPVKVSAEKNPVSQGSSNTNDSVDSYTPNTYSGRGKAPDSKDKKPSSGANESGDRYTPNISEGSGKIPESRNEENPIENFLFPYFQFNVLGPSSNAGRVARPARRSMTTVSMATYVGLIPFPWCFSYSLF